MAWEGMSLCLYQLGMANLYLPKLFDELQKYVIVHAHHKTAIMFAELASPTGINLYMHKEPSLSGPQLGHLSQDLSQLY